MLYVNPLATPFVVRGDRLAFEAAREKIALEELEHYFAFMLLREMRKTVSPEVLFDGGQEKRLYEEMLDDALSGELAKSGQLGIAKNIAGQLRAAEIRSGLKAAPSAGNPEGNEPAAVRGVKQRAFSADK